MYSLMAGFNIKSIKKYTATATSIILTLVLLLAPTTHAVAVPTDKNGCNFSISGSVWTLENDCTSTAQINIPTGVTLEGNAKTIFASFPKTNNDNNSAIGISADNVTIQNLTIDGTGGLAYPNGLHGINGYVSEGISVTNVTVKNMSYSGIVVNSSELTTSNVTTAGNGWSGINVDAKTNNPSALHITGPMNQTDLAHIYVDDTTKSITIHDDLSQYNSIDNPPDPNGYVNDRLYTRDVTAPDNLSVMFNKYPSDAVVASGGYTDAKDFVFTLSADGSPTRYQLKYWNDISGSSFKQSTPWSPSNISSYTTSPASLDKYKDKFTQGEGTHYFSFSACDAAGNCSPYTTAFVISYDMTAPDVPVLETPVNNSIIQGDNLTNQWSDVLGASGYTYQSYNVLPNGTCDLSKARYTATYTKSQTNTRNVSDLSFCWQVRAFDPAGNKSAWSPVWKVTIDNTAPVSPANLSMKNGSNDVIPNDGHTNSYKVTTSWAAAADASYYEYSYWNNIAGNKYKEDSRYIATPVNGTSLSGVFNQGEGTHYVAVRAVDAAGNKSPWSGTYAVTYDTTAPVVSVTGPATPIVGTPVTPTTIATDTNLPLTYVWTALDPADQTLLSDDSIAEPTITPTVAGTYDYELTVTDPAGNSATADLSFVWEQTPTAPAKPADPVIPPTEDVTGPVVAGASTNTPLALTTTPQTNTATIVGSPDTVTEPEAEAVLSAADGIPSDSTDDTSVKLVANTGAEVKSDNAFFGSVWSWALFALAAFGLLIFFLFRRRNDDES